MVKEGITWSVQFQEIIFDDIDRLLSGLNREGQQSIGYIKSFLGTGKTIDRRDNALKILEDMNFISRTQKGNTSMCKITENGKKYLYSREDNKVDDKYIFHSNLYKNVLHYSYAYDFIIKNELNSFKKSKLIEMLVLNSSNEFGTRLYDWKSGEYVIDFMEALDILSKNNDIYTLKEKYRQKFNESKFIELVRDSFNKEKVQYTKSLCEYLQANHDEFMVTEEYVPLEYIYKKLELEGINKNLNLKFISGLPRPPIPNNHTLVELK